MRKICIHLLIISYINFILSPATYAIGRRLNSDSDFENQGSPLGTNQSSKAIVQGNSIHLQSKHFSLEPNRRVIFQNGYGEELGKLVRDKKGIFHLYSSHSMDFHIDDEVSVDSMVVHIKGDFIINALTQIGLFDCQSASGLVNNARFIGEKTFLYGVAFLNLGEFITREFLTCKGSGYFENAQGALLRVIENFTGIFSEFKVFGEMYLPGVSRVSAEYAEIEGALKCHQAHFSFDTDTLFKPATKIGVGYGLALSSRGKLTFLGKLYEDQSLRNDTLIDRSLVGIQLVAGSSLYQHGTIDLESLPLRLFATENYGETFGFIRSGVFPESTVVVDAKTAFLDGETITHSDYILNAICTELDGHREVGARFVVNARNFLVQKKDDETSAKLVRFKTDDLKADGTIREGDLFVEANNVNLGSTLDSVKTLAVKARDKIVLEQTFRGNVQEDAVLVAGDDTHRGIQLHKNGAQLNATSIVVQSTGNVESGAKYGAQKSVGIKGDEVQLEGFDVKADSFLVSATGGGKKSKISGNIDVSESFMVDSHGLVDLTELKISSPNARIYADRTLTLDKVTHKGKNLALNSLSTSISHSRLDLSDMLTVSSFFHRVWGSIICSKNSRVRALLNLEFLNLLGPGGIRREDFWHTAKGPNSKWYSEWWKQPILRTGFKMVPTLALMYAAGPLKVALLLQGLINGIKGVSYGLQSLYHHWKKEKMPDDFRASRRLEIVLDGLDLMMSVAQLTKTIQSLLPDSVFNKKTDTPKEDTKSENKAKNPPKKDDSNAKEAEKKDEETQTTFWNYAEDVYKRFITPNFASSPDSWWVNMRTAAMAHFGDTHTTTTLFDFSAGNLFLGSHFNRQSLLFCNTNAYLANSRTMLNLVGFADFDSFLAYQANVTSFGSGYVAGARYGIFGNTVTASRNLIVLDPSIFGGRHIGLNAGRDYLLSLPDHLPVYGSSLTLCGKNLDDIPNLMKQEGKYDGLHIRDTVSVTTGQDVVFTETTQSKSRDFHLHAKSIKVTEGVHATREVKKVEEVKIPDGQYPSWINNKYCTLTVSNGKLTVVFLEDLFDSNGGLIMDYSNINHREFADGEYTINFDFREYTVKIVDGKLTATTVKKVTEECGKVEVTAPGTLGFKSDTNIDLGAYTVTGGYGFTSLEAEEKINTIHKNDFGWHWGAATIVGGNGITYQYQDPITGKITTRSMGIYIDAKEFNGEGCSFISPGDCLAVVPDGFTNKGYSKQWISEQSFSGKTKTEEVKKVSFSDGTYHVGKLIIRAANGKIDFGAGNFFLRDGGELYAPKGVSFQQLEGEERHEYTTIGLFHNVDKKTVVKSAIIANGISPEENNKPSSADAPPPPPKPLPNVENPLYILAPEGDVLLQGVVYLGKGDHLYLQGKRVIFDRRKMTNKSLQVGLMAWQNAAFFEVWKTLDALQGADDLMNQMKGDLEGNPLLTLLSPNASAGAGIGATYIQQEVLGPGSIKTDKITVDATESFTQRGGYSFEAKVGHITTPLWVQEGAKLKGYTQYVKAGGEASFNSAGPDAGGVARGGYTKTTTWASSTANIGIGYFNVGCLKQDCGTLQVGKAHGSIGRVNSRERYNTQTSYNAWGCVSPTGRLSGGVNFGTSAQWVPSGIMIEEGSDLIIGGGNMRGATFRVGNANSKNGHVFRDTRLPDFTFSFSASGSMNYNRINPTSGNPTPKSYTGSLGGSASVNGWGGGLMWSPNLDESYQRPHHLWQASGTASFITPWFTLQGPLITGINSEEWGHFGKNSLEAFNYGPFYPWNSRPTQQSILVGRSLQAENLGLESDIPDQSHTSADFDQYSPIEEKSSSIKNDPELDEPDSKMTNFMKTPYGYVNQAGFVIPWSLISSFPSLLEDLQPYVQDVEAPRHLTGLYFATEAPVTTAATLQAWDLHKKYGNSIQVVHFEPPLETLTEPLRYKLNGSSYEFSYRLPGKNIYLESVGQLETALGLERWLAEHPSLYVKRAYGAMQNPGMAIGITSKDLPSINGVFANTLIPRKSPTNAFLLKGELGIQNLTSQYHMFLSTYEGSLDNLFISTAHEGTHAFWHQQTGNATPSLNSIEGQEKILKAFRYDGARLRNSNFKGTLDQPYYYFASTFAEELGLPITEKMLIQVARDFHASLGERVPIFDINTSYLDFGKPNVEDALRKARKTMISEIPPSLTELECRFPGAVNSHFPQTHKTLENILNETSGIPSANRPPPILGNDGKPVFSTPIREVSEGYKVLRWYQNPTFQKTLKGIHGFMPLIDYGFHVHGEYSKRGNWIEAGAAASLTTPIDAIAYGGVLAGVGYLAGGPAVWVLGGSMVATSFIPDYDPQVAAAADKAYFDCLKGGGVMGYHEGAMLPSQAGALSQGIKWLLESPGWVSEAVINSIDTHYPGFIPAVSEGLRETFMREYGMSYED